MNYVYDGDGNRLYKATGSTPNKIYWYGAGTEILDESDGSGNMTNEYVFFGGKRVAMDVISSGSISSTYYYAEDFLGSSRAMVQAGQTTACFDADFLPFGREKDNIATCTQNDYKFEGKERDAETGNDDFGARYYSSNFGRWLSPDWSSTPAPASRSGFLRNFSPAATSATSTPGTSSGASARCIASRNRNRRRGSAGRVESP